MSSCPCLCAVATPSVGLSLVWPLSSQSDSRNARKFPYGERTAVWLAAWVEHTMDPTKNMDPLPKASAGRPRQFWKATRWMSLASLPTSVAQVIVTSPPYYGQRDYCVSGQLGTEETSGQYVDRLVGIFDECGRVLRRRWNALAQHRRQVCRWTTSRNAVARRFGAQGRWMDSPIGHHLAQAECDAIEREESTDARPRVPLPFLAAVGLRIRRGCHSRAPCHIYRSVENAGWSKAFQRTRYDA